MSASCFQIVSLEAVLEMALPAGADIVIRDGESFETPATAASVSDGPRVRTAQSARNAID